MTLSIGQKVTTLPNGLALAADRIPGIELKGTSGINGTVGASLETICTQGGIRNLLSSAEQLKIKSSSTSDTNSGSGAARRIKLRGIDGSGAAVDENINLNGTAAVTTTNSYRHVNDVFVTKVGSAGQVNAGTISVSNNADDTVLYEIAVGEAQQQSASFAIPTGHFGYLTSFVTTATGDAQISIWINKDPDNIPFRQVLTTIAGQGAPVTYNLPNPFQIPANGIIEFRAKSLTGGNVKAAADFQLLLEKE
tara:strand:- start:745 stop:1497 length:753 start_codon:yes stop_codon:yes gene_type:complete